MATKAASRIITKMRAWQIDSYVGHNSVCERIINIPTIQCPNDVLVQVKAASVNPLDVMMAKGYGRNGLTTLRDLSGIPSLPLTLGRDFSGVVADVGMDSKYQPGDEVWGTVFPSGQGSHAEFVVASQASLSPKPKTLDHLESASLPYVAMTTWSSLRITGGLGPTTLPGTNVLVIGASGGVGTFAVQLLKVWNCNVIATCQDDAFEMVSDLRADVVLDYKSSDFQGQMEKLKGKFDVVLDCAGNCKAEDYAKYLKPWNGSQFITLTSPLLRSTDSHGLLLGSVDTLGQLLGHSVTMISSGGHAFKWGYFMPSSSALKSVANYVDGKKIKAVIQRVYSASEIVSAYDQVANGGARGKIVVDFQ